MANINKDDPRVAPFLKELTELTVKHGLVIGGCGCCNSPFLDQLMVTGKYTYKELADGDLGWEATE